MKKRPGSIGSSPRRDASPASSEDAVNKVLITMHTKLKELEGKYIALVSQCQGVMQESKAKSREVTPSDVSFFDESQYLHHLRTLDEDKEKLESELNYILKAKKTLTMESGAKEDETVKQIYSDLSEALRVTQTQILKMLQGTEWSVRSRASDIFTNLSDTVWTQVSLLRSRTESREMKELLNEVVRLEQSKQVLDIQTEEYQESIRQKYKSRHHRDKRKITTLQTENKRLESALQEAVVSRAAIRSSSSSLNASLKPVTRQSANYRSARSSVSPTARKRLSEYTDDMGVAEKELLFHSMIGDSSKRVRTSAVQTHLQDTDSADLELRFRMLASASKKYVMKTQKLVKRAKDSASEEALQALLQTLSSMSVEDSTDFDRSTVFLAKDKEALEQTNSMLEKENARLDSMLQEVQDQYSHLYESLEKMQRSKPEVGETSKRMTIENQTLAAKVKDLEHALDCETKLTKKMKRDHKAAIEDLIKDCTELTNEVKLLSEEKGQLLTSFEKKSRECEQERIKAAALLRDSKQVVSMLIQEVEKSQIDRLKSIDSHFSIIEKRIKRVNIDVPQSLSTFIEQFFSCRKSISSETVAMVDLRRENEKLKSVLQEMSTASDRLILDLKSQSAGHIAELKRVSGLLAEQKAANDVLGKTIEDRTEMESKKSKQREEEIRALDGKVSQLTDELFRLSEEKASTDKRCEDLLGMEQSHKIGVALSPVDEEPQESDCFSFEEKKPEEALEENLGSAEDVLAIQIQELETQLGEEQREKESIAGRLNDAKSLAERLVKEVARLEVKIREDAEMYEKEKMLTESVCDKLKNECEKARNECEKMRKDMLAAIDKSQKLSDKLTSTEKSRQEEIASIRTENDHFVSELSSLREEMKVKAFQHEAKLKEISSEHRKQLSDSEAQIRKKDREIDSLRQTIDSLQEDQSHHIEELTDLGRAKSMLDAKIRENQQLQESLKNLSATYKEVAEDKKNLKANLDECRLKLSKTEEQLLIAGEEIQAAKKEADNKGKLWAKEREEYRSEAVRLAHNLEDEQEHGRILEAKLRNSEEKETVLEGDLRNSEEKARIFEEKVRIFEEKAKHAEEKARNFEAIAKSFEEKAKSSEERALISENKARICEESAKAAESKAKSSEEQSKSLESRAKSFEDKANSYDTRAKLSEEKAKNAEERSSLSEEKVRTIEEKLRQSEDKVRNSEEKCRNFESRIKELESLIQAQASTLTKKVTEIQSLRDTVSRTESLLASTSSEFEKAKAMIKSLNEDLSQIERKISKCESDLLSKSQELATFTQWLDQMSEYLGSSSDGTPEKLSKLHQILKRGRTLLLRFSLWASEIDVHISDDNFEKSIEMFTDALAVLAREKQSLERNLNSVLESTAQGGDSSSELRLEIEKLHMKNDSLICTVEEQKQELNIIKRQLESAQLALDEEKHATFSRIESIEKQYEIRLREKTYSLSSDLAAKENRCAVLETEFDKLRKQSDEAKILTEDLQTQLTNKLTEIETLTEALKAQQKDSMQRAQSPNFDFAEEEIAVIVPAVRRDEEDDSFKAQVQGLIDFAPSPGTVVKTVSHEEFTWNLVFNGEKRFAWVMQRDSEDSEIDDERIEDNYRKLELEIVKKQQVITKIGEMLKPHTTKPISDVVQALENVLSEKSSVTPRLSGIPKLVMSGLKESSDGLLDTPRVLSSRTPREPSSSMERQFQAIEKDMTKLQHEIKERDKRLREDAEQIIVLQTENNRLKSETNDYEITIGRLEEQLKLKNEELHRVSISRKSDSGMSLPMLRNSLLRLIAELPSLQRETEDMVKTLFSLLGMSQQQIELTEQARKATKVRKVSLLAQLMS